MKDRYLAQFSLIPKMFYSMRKNHYLGTVSPDSKVLQLVSKQVCIERSSYSTHFNQLALCLCHTYHFQDRNTILTSVSGQYIRILGDQAYLKMFLKLD